MATYDASTTVTKTASVAFNFYVQTAQPVVTFSTTPASGSAPKGSVVTVSATVKDQFGQPITGNSVSFFRSGAIESSCTPSYPNGYTASTNAAGTAGYSFTCGNPGTSSVTIIVSDGSGNEIARGVRNITFTGGAPTPSGIPAFTQSASVVNAGGADTIRITGTAGSAVQLLAYYAPSTTYSVIASGTLPASGVLSITAHPATNGRFYVRYVGAGSHAASQPVAVRAVVSLAASAKGRVGTFTGHVGPSIAGRTVTIYFIKGGTAHSAGSTKTAANGNYKFSRTFAAPGQTITFFAQTTGDSRNASGKSASHSIKFGK